jgi:elongator complex protein 2
MVQASATVAYIAAAANRFPFAADISPESLVAFGSHKLISLWNLPDERIHAALPGHEGIVTCLRFVNGSCFISGDDKGVLRCWEKSGSQVTPNSLAPNPLALTCSARPSQWSIKQKIKAHGQPLSCMSYFDGYLLTGSSDSTVKVWTVDPKNGAGTLIVSLPQPPFAEQITR